MYTSKNKVITSITIDSSLFDELKNIYKDVSFSKIVNNLVKKEVETKKEFNNDIEKRSH